MKGILSLAAILFIAIYAIVLFLEWLFAEDSEGVGNSTEGHKTQEEFFYGRKKFGNANGYDRCGMTIIKNKI